MAQTAKLTSFGRRGLRIWVRIFSTLTETIRGFTCLSQFIIKTRSFSYMRSELCVASNPNSIKCGPLWKTTQYISGSIWNLMDRYCAHKWSPFVHILIQVTSAHTHHCISLRATLKLSCHKSLDLPNFLLHFLCYIHYFKTSLRHFSGTLLKV